jgi:hypothetical protein
VPSQLVLIIATDPPRKDDADEVAEAKAVTVAEAWCELLRARGLRVTFGGLLTDRTPLGGAA